MRRKGKEKGRKREGKGKEKGKKREGKGKEKGRKREGKERREEGKKEEGRRKKEGEEKRKFCHVRAHVLSEGVFFLRRYFLFLFSLSWVTLVPPRLKKETEVQRRSASFATRISTSMQMCIADGQRVHLGYPDFLVKTNDAKKKTMPVGLQTLNVAAVAITEHTKERQKKERKNVSLMPPAKFKETLMK
eukprot:Lithocolla_globosa_v1_NODE_765_length_3321_cov_45.866462.p3 type:complete len:189 gc:universal NODE_765_length_3321_cov_45.866462:2387-1821(-)